MKLPITSPLFLRLAAALALLIPALAQSSTARPPAPDVLVVSDVLSPDSGRLLPAPDHPLHYYLVGPTERLIGDSVAREPKPDPAKLRAQVEKALASQGYLRTDLGGALPDEVIIVSWGAANLTAGDSDPINTREIAALVGADRAAIHSLSVFQLEAINDAANQDRLYLFVGAYEADALRRHEKKLLWRTRISIESARHSLPESIETMLADAAPFFGRDTKMPVRIDEAARRQTEVRVGTPEVISDPAP